MLTFVLPTEKRLVDLFWTFFKYLDNQGKLKEPSPSKNFVDAGVSF